MNGFKEAETRELIGLFLRLSIGILFFVVGLNKFLGGLQRFAVDYIASIFQKTWLPDFVLYPFGYLLPFVELIGGFFLIIGLFTRRTMLVLGALLLVLQFGQYVLGQPENYAAAARSMNYIFALAAAFWFVRENPYSVDALRHSV